MAPFDTSSYPSFIANGYILYHFVYKARCSKIAIFLHPFYITALLENNVCGYFCAVYHNCARSLHGLSDQTM